MKKEEVIAAIITAMIVVWLIMLSSCSSYKMNQHLKEDGHFPGWIVEPYYGPHEVTHAQQIELRNAYSDGWQDGRGSNGL